MIVEEINKNKNTITIIVFVFVCLILNLESIAAIFNFKVPQIIKEYAPFFPLLFAVVVFTQKKTNSVTVNNENLWDATRKKTLYTNNKRAAIRYGAIGGIGILFIIVNLLESNFSLNSQSMSIVFGLIIAVIIMLLYAYLKKGFLIGYCDEGILYGYSSKIMLISWEHFSDFELVESKKKITIYCQPKLPITKIVLRPQIEFTNFKSLVIKKLEYKNVSKLLTND